VSVVADERGLPQEALAFGAEAAARHGVGLEVSRAWSTLHESPPQNAAWLAEQQEELDAQLADWRTRYTALPVVARIELDDAWPERLRSASSLLVVPGYAAALLRERPPDRIASCPVAVVPSLSATPADLLDLPGPGRSALPVGSVRSSNGDA
jgi:hypothetical protein